MSFAQRDTDSSQQRLPNGELKLGTKRKQLFVPKLQGAINTSSSTVYCLSQCDTVIKLQPNQAKTEHWQRLQLILNMQRVHQFHRALKVRSELLLFAVLLVIACSVLLLVPVFLATQVSACLLLFAGEPRDVVLRGLSD